MKITGANYKRVFNLGPYQSETIELYAELGEGDDPDQVVLELKERVAALGGNNPTAKAKKQLAEIDTLEPEDMPF